MAARFGLVRTVNACSGLANHFLLPQQPRTRSTATLNENTKNQAIGGKAAVGTRRPLTSTTNTQRAFGVPVTNNNLAKNVDNKLSKKVRVLFTTPRF